MKPSQDRCSPVWRPGKMPIIANSISIWISPSELCHTAAINIQASLHEAQAKMTETGAEALYVVSTTVPGIPRVYGVLTKEDVDSGYRC